MKKIEREAYQKRLDRISQIFAGMATHADQQSQMRCPYKDRFDECTAKFGCRFQRKPREGRERFFCASDDQLDYRSAWESEPDLEAEVKAKIRAQKADAQKRRGSG